MSNQVNYDQMLDWLQELVEESNRVTHAEVRSDGESYKIIFVTQELFDDIHEAVATKDN